MKKWLFVIASIALLVAGGWFINYKQPVSILETLPENLVVSELKYVFMYGLNTYTLSEQEEQQFVRLLSEENFRKNVLVDLNEMHDHVRLNLTFGDSYHSVNFLIDSSKQEVFVMNGATYHPFSVIEAVELLAFVDGLESKQE